MENASRSCHMCTETVKQNKYNKYIDMYFYRNLSGKIQYLSKMLGTVSYSLHFAFNSFKCSFILKTELEFRPLSQVVVKKGQRGNDESHMVSTDIILQP